MPSLHFSLPLPPSFNAQYYTHQGYHVLTPWSRRYRAAVEFQMRRMHWQDRLGDTFLAAVQQFPLALLLRFYFATPHRRDLDSGLKIVQDAVVTGGLGVDDQQVVDIRLLKYIDPQHPRVEIEVDLVKEWDFSGRDVELFAPFALTLPLAPSVNNQYVIVNGRRRRSNELRRFRQMVSQVVVQTDLKARLPASLRKARNPSHLACYLDFFFSSGSRRDVDSGLKATLDALFVPSSINDNRVVDLHCTRRVTNHAPYTIAQLEVIEDWQFDTQHPVLMPQMAPDDDQQDPLQ